MFIIGLLFIFFVSQLQGQLWLLEYVIIGSTEYNVFLVESLKFKQYQFAQVVVTRESTQSSQFTRMRDSACACTRMLDGAHERTQARA